MIWLAGSLVYALVGLVCARLAAGHLAWRMFRRDYFSRRDHDSPTGDQWMGAWCVGLLAALVWPLIGLLVAFPSERWAVGEERRQIQRRQAERIAELERELDLR